MADPDKFDGQRSKLRSFLVKLNLKLQEPKSFKDEQARMRYVIGRLDGIALEQVMNFVTVDGIQFSTVQSMIDHLKQCFDDPDRIGTATRALRSTKQGTRDFATYFAEFQRYALQVDWNDAAIRAELRDGLSPELLGALVTIDEPESYTDFTNLLMKIDTKLRANKNRITPRPPAPPQTPKGHTKQYNTSATPGATGAATNPTASNSGHYGPAPMDISANRRRLTPEERARRIAQGLCLYCAGAGHIAHQCPNRGVGALRAAEAYFAAPPLANNEAHVQNSTTGQASHEQNSSDTMTEQSKN